MKELIKDIQFTLQEMELRSVEMVDRYPIRQIVENMRETLCYLHPSEERLILKEYISRLEEVIK